MLGRLKFEIDELVNEMLDQLPEEVFKSKTTTFLDPCMGGGQFVKEVEARLRKYGHSDANIAKRVFGVESSELRVKYAVNKHGLVGQYSVHKNYLESDETMKFDVVIGNPPYNDSSTGNIPIYHSFVINAKKYADFISLIIPASAATSDERYGDVVRQNIFDQHTKKIRFLGAGAFEGAIVDTFYYVYDKNYSGKTRIESPEAFYIVDTSVENYIFKDKVLYSILKKCGVNNSRESWIKFNRIEKEHTSKTLKKVVKLVNRNGIIYERAYLDDPNADSHRVVTSFLSNSRNHLDATWYVPPGCTIRKGYTYAFAKNKTEGKNLAAFLRSSLCCFLHRETRTSRSLRTPQLKFIPKIDLTRTWTDEELYKHFKLTKEEIAYIEATVK